MAQPSQFDLLRERRFGPFFSVQFCGALNDNVYKNALLILLTFQTASMTTMSPGLLVNLCAGLFILPFFLFSATAGQLADKYEKARLIRLVKAFEIVIMIIGAFGFYFLNLTLLLTALFMMGTHSALFGPVKYAYLPQHLKRDELVGGNGLVDAGTFIAILLGTLLGGTLAGIQPSGMMWVSATALVIAVLGYWVSHSVPLSPAPSPDLKINWNLVSATWINLKLLRTNRTVFLSVLGISWFWFYGALFLTQFPDFTQEVLGGSEHVVTILLAIFSIGVGSGSLLCEKLSGHKIEIGLVPLGSIGLTLFAVDLFFAVPASPAATPETMDFLRQPGSWRVLFDLLMIGIFGGFYIVPLYALIQSRSEPGHQSRVIAGNNIMNAFFMALAAGVAILGLKSGLTIPQLFLLTGLLNLLVAIYIYTQAPEFLMRFLVWLLIHSVYRLAKKGIENIPDEGAAILVANPVTCVDALVIAAACPRPVRYVMDHRLFNTPLLRFLLHATRSIPIASARENSAALDKVYDDIAKGLAAGDLICIFPEGTITRDGEMQPFRGDIRRIVDVTPVPVVPIALRGLWDSFFGRQGGALIVQLLRRGLFGKIGMSVGVPIAAQLVTPAILRQRVTQMHGTEK